MPGDHLRKALERIAKYDASKGTGGLDEWAEAEAFRAVRQIAREAIDPDARDRRVAQVSAERELTRKRIKALQKGQRYYLNAGFSGCRWVKYVKGHPTEAYLGIVIVREIDQWNRAGGVREVNVDNLWAAPGVPIAG